MLEIKDAVRIAREHALEMLGYPNPSLEEIELGQHQDREVWMITLGFPRDLEQIAPLARIGADPLQYKRFLIDAETGKMLAMRLREVASR
jgi:hypothetical protein